MYVFIFLKCFHSLQINLLFIFLSYYIYMLAINTYETEISFFPARCLSKSLIIFKTLKKPKLLNLIIIQMLQLRLDPNNKIDFKLSYMGKLSLMKRSHHICSYVTVTSYMSSSFQPLSTLYVYSPCY